MLNVDATQYLESFSTDDFILEKGDIVVIAEGTIHELYNGDKLDLGGKIGLIETSHFADMENKTGEIMYHVKHFIPPVGGVCVSGDRLKLAENPESRFLEFWCVIDDTWGRDSCTSAVVYLKKDCVLFDGLLIQEGTRGIVVRRVGLEYYEVVLFFGKRAILDLVKISAFEGDLNDS